MENQKQNEKSQQKITSEDKNAAAISYIWIMSVFVYLMRRKQPFIRFHALQAMALFFLSIIFWFIPVINTGLEVFLGALMVLGFLKASQGRYFKIPLIGHLVFTKNPFKTVTTKITNAFHFVFLWSRTKMSKKKEIEKKFLEVKKELTQDFQPHEASIDTADIKQSNDVAAFSYLWILSVIIINTNEKSEFVRFHARQGVVLFVLSVLFSIIPVVGFYLNVLILLLSIGAFIMAFSGEQYKVPIVHYIASKNHNLEAFYINLKTTLRFLHYILGRSVKSEEKRTWQNIRSETKESYTLKKNIHEPEIQDARDIAAASYLFLGPILWFIHKRKKFVVFHTKQATLLFIAFWILFLISPIRWLSMLVIALMVTGYIRAMHSEYYYMPFVYDLLKSNVTLKSIKEFIFHVLRSCLRTFKRLFVPAKEKVPAGQTQEVHTEDVGMKEKKDQDIPFSLSEQTMEENKK